MVLSEPAQQQKSRLDATEVANQTKPEKLTRKLWEELRVMDIETLTETLTSVSSAIKEKKVQAISGRDLVPMIGESDGRKVLVIPSSLKSDPNYMGIAMLRFAQFAQYEIREFDYHNEKDSSEKTDIKSEVGLAFYQSLDDIMQSVNITSKAKNMHEKVRKFVRGQQVLGFIGSRKQKPDILKRNQTLWGNHPQETEDVQVAPNRFTQFKVSYFKREMTEYWRESKFKKQLTEIFVQMIRDTWTAVPHEILYNNVVDSLLPMVELVKLYCSHTEEINVGSVKKPDIRKKTSVPSKPKESPLLLKEEQQILNELLAPLFGKTFFEDNIQDWPLFLLGSGFVNVKSDLQEIYRTRGVFVRNFAQLTTNRLGQIRTLPGCPKDMKKKDVKPDKVAELILLRQNAIDSFVDELLHLDPQLNGYLAVWFAGINEIPKLDTSGPDFRKSVKSTLESLLIEKGLYKDINRTADQLQAWTAYYGELSEVAQKRVDLVREFKRVLRFSAQPRAQYQKKTYLIDDFMKYQQMEKQRQFALNQKIKDSKPNKEEDRVVISIAGPSHAEAVQSQSQKLEADERTERMNKLKNSKELQMSLEDFNKQTKELDVKLKGTNTSPANHYNRISQLWMQNDDAKLLKEVILTALLCIFTGVDMMNTDFPYKYEKSKDRGGGSLTTMVINQFNNRKAAWQPKAMILK
jgi:hypothetical protein